MHLDWDVNNIISSLTLDRFSSLNGVKLEMRGDTLPPLNPVNQQSGTVTFPSFSFGFVVLPSARVTLCMDRM